MTGIVQFGVEMQAELVFGESVVVILFRSCIDQLPLLVGEQLGVAVLALDMFATVVG